MVQYHSRVDLVRREIGSSLRHNSHAHNREGKKMENPKGALWVDAIRRTPYEFYQYWRNIEDADVKTCLLMLTFLPIEEIEKLASLKDEQINRAKEVLAFEVTKLVHGEEEAKKAKEAARALFSGQGNLEDVPKTVMPKERFSGDEWA